MAGGSVSGAGGEPPQMEASVRRDDYLDHECVRPFVEWLRRRVGDEEAFKHSYRMVRPACDWYCNSLWEAHEKYCWQGKDFEDNQRRLDCLAEDIRRAVCRDDRDGFLEAACRILRWGGVTAGNKGKLYELGPEALPTFHEAARLLDPSDADMSQLGDVRYMNSGWTKVYALMLDDFPIYDGRVGAAMGYLVRRYCTDEELREVPALLRFRWLAGKGNHNRNPSVGSLQFPRLSHTDPRRWAECNVWAAWVLGEVACEGRFGKLCANRRLRALEAALFMIGYELP